MKAAPNKLTRRELRTVEHPTRAPRLKPIVKATRIEPVEKPKKTRNGPKVPRKPQGPTLRQQKDYQLPGKRH